MLLAIVVGNTSTKWGIFDGEKLRVTWRWATSIHRMADEYAAMLLPLLNYNDLTPADVKDVVLASVVPPLNPHIVNLAEQYFRNTPLIIEAGIKTGLKLRVDNPREVGADRIVNATAIRQLYGTPAIAVDMGTACVFDCVSREGDYVGGAIAPGLNIAAEALFARTAKLPRIELTHPKTAIGTNTISAMRAGLVFGYVGLIEGIVSRIQKEIGGKARVVATGGDAALIAAETGAIDIVNPNLALQGLRVIFQMNRAEG
jgi:type III pantothenate kinase